MENLKIKVSNENESREAQELFFELGFEWFCLKKEITRLDAAYIYAKDGALTAGFNDLNFEESTHQKITLLQLKDMVVLHRNSIDDATHIDPDNNDKFVKLSDGWRYWTDDGMDANGQYVFAWQSNGNTDEYLQRKLKPILQSHEYLEFQDNDTYKLIDWKFITRPPESFIKVPDSADFFLKMCTGLRVGYEFFFKYFDSDLKVYRDSEWIHASYDCIQDYIDEGDELLWSRELIQKPKPDSESNLISGADAKKAWANGEIIQTATLPIFDERSCWMEITKNYELGIFDNAGNVFRLKPRTIKLEIEIPAPFEPKEGERYYTIQPCNESGWTGDSWLNSDYDDNTSSFGCWRTEEEIKVVVEALRKIKGEVV